MSTLTKISHLVIAGLTRSNKMISKQLKKSVFINRPLETCFSFLTDARNFKTWLPGLVSSKRIAGLTINLGSTFHQTFNMQGQRVEFTMRVNSFSPLKMVSMTFLSGHSYIRRTWYFEPVLKGTRLYYSEESEIRESASSILSSLFKRDDEDLIQKVLMNLKKILEREKFLYQKSI